LAKILGKKIGEEETRISMNNLYIEKELESMGDDIDKNLMAMAKKMIGSDLLFSEQGSKEVAELHRKVMDNREENAALAKKITEVYSDIEKRKYQVLYIEKLHKELEIMIDTSSVHLDVITYYARINDRVIYIENRIIWHTKKYV